MSMPPPDRIPVAVVTGFLGSGKTTLLNALLRHPELRDTAVIVNELGEIGLDHLLVVGGDENVVLLNAGCLCCAMLGTFKETLADLSYRRARAEVPPFARVIVETTGLADPAPILQSLLRDSFLSAYYALGGVTTTVDAVLGEAELGRHPEAVKQAAVADHLVVTKTDLTDGAIPESLRADLERLNPTARVFLGRAALSPATLFAGRAVPLATPAAMHEGHHHHAADIRADSFILDGPATWAGIAAWSDFAREFFGHKLLRCKGLLVVERMPGPVLIQGVQTVFANPERLADWPDADRRSRLVCITQGIDKAVVDASLSLFAAEPGTYRPASIAELMEARV
jgi:G3E family GTPase